MACATRFPLDTVISMKYPDSASIFTAIIKALDQIKDSAVQIYYVYRLTFVYRCFIAYEAGTFLDWDGDTKVCLLKVC